MSTLLEINGLYTSFGRDETEIKAVREVSLKIEKGETHALVGESGSGKSVTALSVMQLLPYPVAWHGGGSIRFLGDELMGAPARRMREIRGNRIAMIFQAPLNSLNPLHSIEKQISEVLHLHKALNPAETHDRVLEMLDLVGLPEAKDRLGALPHEFSGGQQQRVMIAMALANDPDLLIADEPTTALDVTIQAQVLKLLKDLQQKLGMAMLLITHDLGIVRGMADRVSVMTDGEIVEQGDLAQVFGKPAHAYTKHLLDAEPKGQPDPAPVDAKNVSATGDLKVWFPIKKGVIRRTVDHVKAVDGITLEVRRGHTLGVVGESGSGKSTFGRALLRLEKSSGEITFEGHSIRDLNKKTLRPLRRQMQIERSFKLVGMGHDFAFLDRRKSVEEKVGKVGGKTERVGFQQRPAAHCCDALPVAQYQVHLSFSLSAYPVIDRLGYALECLRKRSAPANGGHRQQEERLRV